MIYMGMRAKIKLIKKLCPEYEVEGIRFSDYTAQELSEFWQDEDLLEDIIIELLDAIPNDEHYV